MKTVARLSAEDRSDLFRNTANRMQMSDAIVEKDFWVCFTLDYLFHRSPWKDSISRIPETRFVTAPVITQNHFFAYNVESLAEA